MSHLVAPSMLSADFANLSNDIKMVNRSEADWFHIDVMDGVFVPNISIGFSVIKAIKKHAEKPLDVHLMIVDPDRYIEEFVKVGADIISIHYESVNHLHRSVHRIKELGAKAGIVLNPHTPVFLLEEIIRDIDLICIMSVNPGYGGQNFITSSIDKIAALKKLITDKGSSALIEVDGGVGFSNARDLVESGADVLVAGNTVFSAKDPAMAISKLKYF